ncbi:MAG: rod shape-determining protein MreC [Deltaproteobacteria bacterium RIFOXYA12_FULL_61_11]|nr:MAG: rod shape-determining protein MreC [Deltaproteobacteria bacterium RIFOXYA12_FULL_61_11]
MVRALFHYSRTLLIVLIILFLINHLTRQASIVPSAVQHIIVYLLSPIQTVSALAMNGLGSAFTHYLYLVNLAQENEALRRKNTILENQIIALREIEIRNQRLTQILELKGLVEDPMIQAQVIARGPDHRRHVLRINKGEADGIHLNDPVINHHGAIGVIAALARHSADVHLLTDFNCYIDSMLQRTRVHGGIYGKDAETLVMKYVERESDVSTDDIVITSGLGLVWPKGIPVGKVAVVQATGNRLFQHIEVSPAVDFQAIEEVMVIVRPREEAQPRG